MAKRRGMIDWVSIKGYLNFPAFDLFDAGRFVVCCITHHSSGVRDLNGSFRGCRINYQGPPFKASNASMLCS